MQENNVSLEAPVPGSKNYKSQYRSPSRIVSALKQCINTRELEAGRRLHRDAVEAGCHTDKYVADALIRMYTKCGSLQQAREVFDRMIRRDAITWTSLMLGYVENGESSAALDLFTSMDCRADHVAYVAALKACAALATQRDEEKHYCLEKGMVIHRQLEASGFLSDISVANTLVDMYGKCGSMKLAREVFNNMKHKNVVSWSCLVLGYVENGESSVALDMFNSMDCEPDRVIYMAALKACARLATERESEKQTCLKKGMDIHRELKKHGLVSNTVVANTLLDMYGKCGSMQHAREVFVTMARKDVVTWNCFILGYIENGQSSVALELFNKIECKPDQVTYVVALKACEELPDKKHALERVIAIHRQLKARRYDTTLLVASTLVDVYGKCGSMHHAREVFDGMVNKSVITWNSIILRYVENGKNSEALNLFDSMGCVPNHATYIAALKACAGLASEKDSMKQACLEKVRIFHMQVKETKYYIDIVVGNTLVDVYGKCGSMESARKVFDRMIHKDVVTWSALILGYVENGENSEALDLFTVMDCEPDHVTYIVTLKACAALGVVSAGKWIHYIVCRHGLEGDSVVANSLVDFYGKCSLMSVAEEVFNSTCFRDIVAFTSLLSGYSSLGESSRVFTLVKEIQDVGLHMDGVTFTCILTACSHAGLVDVGKTYFESMFRYGVTPTIEHYDCIVDMLGRANRLEEALFIVNTMPFKPGSFTWRSLLGACKKWKNVKVAKVAFDALVADEKEEAAAYVLMREIYESSSICQDEQGIDTESKSC